MFEFYADKIVYEEIQRQLDEYVGGAFQTEFCYRFDAESLESDTSIITGVAVMCVDKDTLRPCLFVVRDKTELEHIKAFFQMIRDGVPGTSDLDLAQEHAPTLDIPFDSPDFGWIE